MKPLAKNNRLNALFYPVSLLIISLLAIVGVVPISVHPAVAGIAVILLIVWIVIAARQVCDLYYDAEFVYLKGVGSSKRIPLTQIKSVRSDLRGMKTSAVTAWRYAIEFDDSLKLPAQIFYEAHGEKGVDEFINVVTNASPNVVIDLKR